MGPYSYPYWLNEVNGIKTYNSNRIATARQHLDQSLSLQGQKEVELDVSPASAGLVQLNSIIPPLPWEGIYHGACPITAQATPNFGFIFSHWYSSASAYNNATQDSIGITLAANTTLIAHFDTCKNVVNAAIQKEGLRLRAKVSIAVSNPTYEWFYNGTSVSTDSIIYNPLNGNYQLKVRFDSCEIQSNTFALNNGDYGIHIFPNPAVDQLHLQFMMGQEEELSCAVYNATGQLVWESAYTKFIGQFNGSIDVSAFARGSYVLRVSTPTKVYTSTFILID